MSAQTGRAWSATNRLAGLRRFALAITVFNVLGHFWFGFEQSWLQPLVALATAYGIELLLETIDAAAHRRRARYRGGVAAIVSFLLSAHITALAISMLLYSNDRLWPMVFATAVAIGSKFVFRVMLNGTSRHFLNPSNFGITVTLLLFPWVGIAPPYHFTENLSGAGDWILPGLIVVSGSFLNARYTRRWPLLAAWLIGFAAQAAFRSVLFDTPLVAGLMPATGTAFVLYTFYMVTDPATTPGSARGQVAFGASVAAAYGVLVGVHVVFGFFFALSIVCIGRGLLIWRPWPARAPAAEMPPVANIEPPARLEGVNR